MAQKRPFPNFSLEDSLAIAQGIQDKNAGKPMNRLLLAQAVDRKPGSSEYRDLLSSSYKYGLTQGTEKAKDISLTSLGEKVTKPLNKAERQKALRDALMEQELLARVYRHYDQHKLPSGEFFQNALEREFGVPREFVAECADLVVKNGEFTGILQNIGGSLHVMLEAEAMVAEEVTEEAPEALAEPGKVVEAQAREGAAPAVPPKPKQIFIGHGKNKKPLDQLKKMLDGFEVPYKVAEEEPHAGRPISEKVAGTMQQCTSGIFIATADEEIYDKDGNAILRPGENVIYELGAGSVLYGKKIVIFKEEGVTFPSDFRDIGYISFQKDKLGAKAMELLDELVGFGILKISAA